MLSGALHSLWHKLRFAGRLLLGAAAALTLFEIVTALGSDEEPSTYGWPGFIVLQSWQYLISLGPVVLASVLVSDLAPKQGLSRWLWMAIAVVVSSLIGEYLALHAPDPKGVPAAYATTYLRFLLGQWFMLCFPAALLLSIYELHRLDLRATEDAYQVRAGRIAVDGELSRAQFQLLRAQVEPHFLFNTLANLRRLYGVAPRAGQELLHSLRQYLTAALPGLRAEHSSLRHEAALIGAYLDIFRVRMGSRLSYEIAFPEDLLDAVVPPMMLLTLVENAIKHGLSPLPEGGFLRLSAEAREGRLELRVADSGRGMGEGSGHGSGLANIRARLAAAYGATAALSLSLNRPRGVTALLHLPLQRAA